jgi:hypothetical protein
MRTRSAHGLWPDTRYPSFRRDPFWGFAPQHIELVSEDKDFTLQWSPRPEQANHGAQDQPVEIVHRDRLLPIRKKPPAVLGLR